MTEKVSEDIFVQMAYERYLQYKTTIGPLAYAAAIDILVNAEQKKEFNRIVISKETN